MPLGNYEYKSDFAKKYVAQGRTEGARQALLAVVAARGLELSDGSRQRIESCSSVTTLEQWIRRAAVVASGDDVFTEPR